MRNLGRRSPACPPACIATGTSPRCTSRTSSARSSTSSSGSSSCGAPSSSTGTRANSRRSGTTRRTRMFESEFMRLAFATGAVVGLLAPAVGFFLVQRRMSLIGDGIGHTAFAGVAAGYLLGVSPVLTALVASVGGAVGIEWLRARRRTAGDQALFLLYRALAGTVLDEEGARVAGVPVGLLNVVVAGLAGVTIAVSMRIVGILLIAALMVLPVIAAGRVAWSMRSALLLAMGIGLAAVFVGLTVAYHADLAPGGAIVLVAAAAFVVTSLLEAVR